MFNIILIVLIILIIAKNNKCDVLCPNLSRKKKCDISDSGSIIKDDYDLNECTSHTKLSTSKNVNIKKLQSNRLKMIKKKIESIEV
jgi:hypothetical protein